MSLALLGNRALLMIKPESANKAIGLFSSAWNKLARNRQLTIGEEAAMPLSEDGRVALTRLGGKPGTVDVLAKPTGAPRSRWAALPMTVAYR